MKSIVLLLAAVVVLATSCGSDESSAGVSDGPLPLREEVAESVSLEDRVVEYHKSLSEGIDLTEWLASSCRQSLGLVSDTDPLIDFLTDRALGWRMDPQEVEYTEISENVIEVTGLIAAEPVVRAVPWVLEDSQWNIDLCGLFIDLWPKGIPLAGENTLEGLEDRLHTIDQAIGEGEVGIYQWLSQRCREAMKIELEEYVVALLAPSAESTDELRLEFAAAEVIEVDGQMAEVTPIVDAGLTLLASGRDVDRWVYELGNWYYDGCPTGQDQQAQLDRMASAHSAILGLEIEGLIETGGYTTDFSGRSSQVIIYESVSDTMEWWTAVRVYMEDILQRELEAVGYDITTADSQYLAAVLRSDPQARVDIQLDPAVSDVGRQIFYVTLRYG